ncbi:glycogen debranching protein GlgX [Naasia sp. SYSU D00948]|uniref:glycogen debranching protein GlgX n=1 Tax=Naasia sp. SYSU D00948 TaxID=2817379 RepID=UPI001B317487|nr:glycogen debranching protein GlgX [Naasia sp. SYSU D00948]
MTPDDPSRNPGGTAAPSAVALTPQDPLRDLGVTVANGRGTLRVWSGAADAVELCLFDQRDPNWITSRIPLVRNEHGVWSGSSSLLTPGRRYGIRVAGPHGHGNTFNPSTVLLDPYARGVSRVGPNSWQSVVMDNAFDWGGVQKPRTPLGRSVIYEAHVRGLTKLNSRIPEHLRGTYAGLANERTIEYLLDLGVTAVELLPVHAFTSERRLIRQGLRNYWGYNTLSFFAPHPDYASADNVKAGPQAALSEFKGMVKLLHQAGIEVILDVVYNHTAEEGLGGPRTSFRGIDNAGYYRQAAGGEYVDTTGCGNTLDFSQETPIRLVLDSVRYWANEMQIDGFRFDLAVALGRDARGYFDPEHPLLLALRDDPALEGVKLIAEPWDVGLGGWQTGNFPPGWSEWNDRFRDAARDFWLTDLAAARRGETTPGEAGRLANVLAGSADLFSGDRGPLASVNFVTAHDGFTLADLTSYNEKHNLGNGEHNRDGANDNRSFNFGVEGDTRSPRILADRRRAMRNLLGTLLLSAGVPMITAGDEFGRSQRGNNNAYNQDSELTWMAWQHRPWQRDLREVTKRLLRLRRENPALRPSRFARAGAPTPNASEMSWYSPRGTPMASRDWHAPDARCIQYLAATTPESEEFNMVLLVVCGAEHECSVRLPDHAGVSGYELLWTSADDSAFGTVHETRSTYAVPGPALALFRAHTTG